MALIGGAAEAGAYNLTAEKFVADPAAAVVCNFSPSRGRFLLLAFLPPDPQAAVPLAAILTIIRLGNSLVRCTVISAPSHSTR